jgi:signal peptidase I
MSPIIHDMARTPTNDKGPAPAEPAKPRTRLQKLWHDYIRPFLIVVLVLGTLRSAVADWNDVPTGSMKPTILEGDRIFVNKLAYDLKIPFTTRHLAEWGHPRHGDIVVLFSPAGGTRLVKRVIGLPGDTVAMRQNRLFLNGRPVPYEAVGGDEAPWASARERADRAFLRESLGGDDHLIMLAPRAPFRPSFGPITIPEGRYLVMGDNRDESADSRVFGLVDRRDIVGRATAVVFSLDRDHYWIPRADRFLHRLS